MEAKEFPRELEVARQSLEGLDGLDVLREFEWNARAAAWVLLCRLTITPIAEGRVPTRTDWFIVVPPGYPSSKIRIHPAKNRGLIETFHHQDANRPGAEDIPWRTGKICVDTGVHVLGRGFDWEPFDAHARLRWRMERALQWLEAANRGELVLPGEPYELPDYRAGYDHIIGFAEDAASLHVWSSIGDRSGRVQIIELGAKPGVYAASAFQSVKGKDLVKYRWGRHIEALSGRVRTGAWIRVSEPPHLEPWRAPETWGELRKTLAAEGIDLMEALRPLVSEMRDGKRHFVLLGVPLPARVGESPQQMHWLALHLPVLSKEKRNGFRKGETAGWINDLSRVFQCDAKLEWARSENWHPGELAARGRLPETVAGRRILLIGCGAVGSQIAELLVRAGARDLVVSDEDKVLVGNLVRHPLTLEDVGSQKSEALARRLNSASPHSSVRSIGTFPPTDFEPAQIDVVLDCTGDAGVSRAMEDYEWRGDKIFLSLSVGIHARRMFCFSATGSSFPNEDFVDQLQPWLVSQAKEFDGFELPREGVGCWHPAFPARSDDIGVLCGVATKWIERSVLVPPTAPTLTVFEQEEDSCGFLGVRRSELGRYE